MKVSFPKISELCVKYKYVAIVLAAGLLLLTLPSGGKAETKESTSADTFDVKAFEKRIEKVLAACEGVGRCEVLLSVDTGIERVFAREQKESLHEREGERESDVETRPTTFSEGSGVEQPMLIKERTPRFRGAIVVCDGAERSEVQRRVLEAVMSLTGLGSDRVSVVKMKN